MAFLNYYMANEEVVLYLEEIVDVHSNGVEVLALHAMALTRLACVLRAWEARFGCGALAQI